MSDAQGNTKLNVNTTISALVLVLQFFVVPSLNSLRESNSNLKDELSTISGDLIRVEQRVDALVRNGPYFTDSDFSREQSITIRLIDDLGEELKDIKGRVRSLEMNRGGSL